MNPWIIGIVAVVGFFLLFPAQSHSLLSNFGFGGSNNSSNSSLTNQSQTVIDQSLASTTTSTSTTTTTTTLSPDAIGRPKNSRGFFDCLYNSDCYIYFDCTNCYCKVADGFCYRT